jgi:thiol:disulfide interchange protein
MNCYKLNVMVSMRFPCVLMALTVLLCALPPQARAADRHVTVRLVPETTSVRPGGTVRVGIEQTISPGWHTYWVNPGDSGAPMRVTWQLPPGFQTSPLIWPVPSRIRTGPLLSYGYEGKAVMMQDLTVPQNLPNGPMTVTVNIETLVCKDICIPEMNRLQLILNGPVPGDSRAWLAGQSVNFPSQSTHQDATYEFDDATHLRLSLVNAGTLFPGLSARADFFPLDWGYTDNDTLPVIHLDSTGTLSIRLKRGIRPFDKATVFHGLLVYKNNKGERSILSIQASASAETLAPAATQAMASAHFREVHAFIPALFLALLGGLILNLMPCVFPVLSMKALSLLSMNEKEKAHARAYGLSYTAGVIVCFLAIAGVLLALKAGGAQIGWGFQLQNPLVVLLLSWLLFVIGLNFSGLFEISGSFANLGSGFIGKQGVRGSFFTGMLAALVATPCTAPFMGAAMGYALLQPAPVALCVFLALGLGLALPYLIVCMSPSLQCLLPRPGRWMQVLREFLAFPMYASAAWLVWVYAMQVGQNGILVALAGMIVLALIVWLTMRMPRTRWPRIAAMAGLVWTGMARPSLPVPAAVAAETPGDSLPFDTQRLQEALQSDDPVFVNMTAAWCITCKINERVALNRQETRALFAANHVRYLRGDWTNQDAAITAFLARYGRSGVPLYVYYGPPAGGQRPDAVILPQILTPAAIRTVFAAKS